MAMKTYKEIFKQKIASTKVNLTKQTEAVCDLTNSSGAYCRVFNGGSWGMAHGEDLTKSGISALEAQARHDIGRTGLPSQPNKMLCLTRGRDREIIIPDTPNQSEARLREICQSIGDYLNANCPNLETWKISAGERWIEKHLNVTTTRSKLHLLVPETVLQFKLTVGGHTLEESVGSVLPSDLRQDVICASLLSLYEHMQHKANTIPPEKGRFTCVIAPQMVSKILELTIGYHARADIMQECFPHGVFLRIPSLSPKLTIMDYANCYFNGQCPFPVFMDDEGADAYNVYLINRGQMDLCMTNRETAGTMEMPLTGNARTGSYKSAPRIHPRNLAVMPWNVPNSNIIASVEDGYYLIDGNNCKWNRDGRFTLNATIGYRIKNGKVCESIMGAEVGGTTLDFLKSISTISGDFKWCFNGNMDDDIKSSVGTPTIKACLDIM